MTDESLYVDASSRLTQAEIRILRLAREITTRHIHEELGSEHEIVARLVAAPKNYVSIYDSQRELFEPSYWRDQTLYHTFSLFMICARNSAKLTPFLHDLHKLGKTLLEAEAKANTAQGRAHQAKLKAEAWEREKAYSASVEAEAKAYEEALAEESPPPCS